ncbi:hypothetical protein [Benzoatithermus flavus]|uniref:Beta-barrel porin 2 n=1 Tax=Benzoatithermus flavus TaxID=3108223 RepID=A0ABU8XXU9_9PROT
MPPPPLPAPARLAAACLLAALLAGVPAARAAEWTGQVRAVQEVGVTDNVALSAGKSKADLSSVSSVAGELTGRTPRTRLTLAAAADLVRYLDRSRYDSDDELLSTRILRLGRRSQLALEGSLRHDSASVDLAQRSSPTQRLDQRRLTLALAPSWTYALGRRDELVLGAGWTRRIFPDGSGSADGPYLAYDLLAFALSWNHDLTRQLMAGTALHGSYFESARQRTTFLSPLLTLRHRPAERRNLEVRAGPTLYAVETQARAAGGTLTQVQEQKLGYTVRASLGQALTPRTTLTLVAEKALEPSGDNGEIVDASRLSLRLVHELGRDWRLELAGLLQRQSGIGGATSFVDRTYVEIEPGLAWALSREAALSLRYRYRHEMFDGKDGDGADAHALILRLGYDLPLPRRGG